MQWRSIGIIIPTFKILRHSNYFTIAPGRPVSQEKEKTRGSWEVKIIKYNSTKKTKINGFMKKTEPTNFTNNHIVFWYSIYKYISYEHYKGAAMSNRWRKWLQVKVLIAGIIIAMIHVTMIILVINLYLYYHCHSIVIDIVSVMVQAPWRASDGVGEKHWAGQQDCCSPDRCTGLVMVMLITRFSPTCHGSHHKNTAKLYGDALVYTAVFIDWLDWLIHWIY